VQRAREEAETHRHDVEQALIVREVRLERQPAELQERERQATDTLAAAREDADRIRDATDRAADRIRRDAATTAAQTLAHADTELRHRHDHTSQDITRLTALHTQVRADMAQLADTPTAALPPTPTPARRSSPA